MRNDFHPCAFAPLSVWASLLWENRGVPREFWGRAARTLGLSALTTPLRLAETVAYGRQVDKTALAAPPVFILGFARSGATHLQNLVAQDARFGFFSTYQGVVSSFALVGRGRLRRFMERELTGQGERPTDNVKISLNSPQEEDMGLANTSAMSFVHQLSFPRQTKRLFEKYVIMGADANGATAEELTTGELLRWENAYLRVLRKAQLLADGKPLVLRNTVNTGRADRLLRLFPHAKFVNIVRNPYDVYPSLMHLYRTLLPLYQLDHYDWDEVERWLVEIYRRTMRKYLRDRKRIPAGHLAEVRYEDVERDPLGELARVYQELGLPAFDAAAPAVSDYLRTLADYAKNRLPMTPEQIDRVTDQWGFVAEEWGYEPPAPAVA